MSTTRIIIGNILSIFAMANVFLSTRTKGKKRMLAFQTANLGFSLVSCVILRGYSGAIQNFVGIIRNLCIIYHKSNRILNGLFVVVVGFILGIILNNRGVLGLLPVVSSTIHSCVIVSPNSTERGLRIVTLVGTICWGIYSLCILNYINFLLNTIVSISGIYYLIKYKRGNIQF